MDRALTRRAILVLALAGATPVVRAQSDVARVSPADSDPFAAIHFELNETADAVLTQTIQQMAKAAGNQSGSNRVLTPELLIGSFEEHYRPLRPKSVATGIERLKHLRASLDPILQSEGVPVEMASVVLVESGARPNALSPKGALGLWQLMPGTATRYGLRVQPGSDERLDLAKSTRAAARYLNDLYQQFGSWPLALAAYNFGEDRLQRSIDQAGTKDFLQLSRRKLLPEETRNYVPAVLAAMQLLGSGQLPDPPNRYSKAMTPDRVFAKPGGQP